MVTVDITRNGEAIALVDATGTTTRFHSFWLRDNALDADTRDPGNGQRLVTLNKLPAELTVSSAVADGNKLTLRFQPEDKLIQYDLDWLLHHAYDTSTPPTSGWLAPSISTWDASHVACSTQYDLLQQDSQTLQEWLSQIQQYGFDRNQSK